MKFSCTKENLQTGLSFVSRVASRNLTLPILGNVLLRAESGVLTLSATNLEVGIVARVRGKTGQGGAITIQARLLSEFVGLLENDRIELEADGTTLRVESEGSKTTIRGMSAEDFPIIPSVAREQEQRLSAETLRTALAQVLFAAAQDTSRPEISGVFLNLSGKTLTLAATDSYRLAERTIKIEKGTLERSTIIPARALAELVRTLPADGEVGVAISESQALFISDSVELTTRLIEGQYPDYRQIIPKSSISEATVEVEPFVKLVRTASLFCKPGINDVTLELQPETKTLQCSAANAELGEHHGSVGATVKGERNTIVFNYRYLLEGLATIGSPAVVLGVTNSASPGVLRPTNDGDYLYLIMPIRQ